MKKYILSSIETMMLELGMGFAFVGSEQKIQLKNGGRRYVDLVFFNINLNCYIIVELKIKKLDIRDIGQLEFYVNFYNDEVKGLKHNNTIGIIICKKNDPEIMSHLKKENIVVTSYKIVD